MHLLLVPSMSTELAVAALVAADLVLLAGSNLKCEFGSMYPSPATFIDGEHIRCTAPTSPAVMTVTVRASYDGHYFSGNPVAFVFYDARSAPTISALTPTWGLRESGATVQIFGLNFAPTGDRSSGDWGGRLGVLSVATSSG